MRYASMKSLHLGAALTLNHSQQPQDTAMYSQDPKALLASLQQHTAGNPLHYLILSYSLFAGLSAVLLYGFRPGRSLRARFSGGPGGRSNCRAGFLSGHPVAWFSCC